MVEPLTHRTPLNTGLSGLMMVWNSPCRVSTTRPARCPAWWMTTIELRRDGAAVTPNSWRSRMQGSTWPRRLT